MRPNEYLEFHLHPQFYACIVLMTEHVLMFVLCLSTYSFDLLIAFLVNNMEIIKSYDDVI